MIELARQISWGGLISFTIEPRISRHHSSPGPLRSLPQIKVVAHMESSCFRKSSFRMVWLWLRLSYTTWRFQFFWDYLKISTLLGWPMRPTTKSSSSTTTASAHAHLAPPCSHRKRLRCLLRFNDLQGNGHLLLDDLLRPREHPQLPGTRGATVKQICIRYLNCCCCCCCWMVNFHVCSHHLQTVRLD